MRQSGITLIEVLVTVVIMAVGLLGLAALQISALRINHDAVHRTLAASFAQELIDRMHANPLGVAASAYVINSEKNIRPVSPVTANAHCFGSPCNPADLARLDVYQWYREIQARLPEGAARVIQQGPLYRIEVYWNASRKPVENYRCPDPGADIRGRMEAACSAIEFLL